MTVEKNYLSDEQLILGIATFLLIYSIDSKEPRGKRIRKKIIRGLKAKLAIYRREDSKRYLELVNASKDIMESAKVEVESRGLNNKKICPGMMFSVLHFRYKDLIGDYDLDVNEAHELRDAFDSGAGSMFTMKYTNVLVAEIMKYTKQDLSKVSITVPHSCGGKKNDSCPACKYEKFIKDGYDDGQVKELVAGYNSDQIVLVKELQSRLRPDISPNEYNQPPAPAPLNRAPYSVLSQPMESTHVKKIF